MGLKQHVRVGREHGHALTDTDLAALRSYGAETAEQIDARINGAVARSDAPAKPNV